MRSPYRVAAGVLLVLVGTSRLAGAATVDAVFVKVTPWMWFEYSVDDGGKYSSELAGQYRWTRTGGDHVGSPSGEFFSFCIELTQNVYYRQEHTFDVVDVADAPMPGGPGVGSAGMGPQKADMLRELWGRHIDEVSTPQTAAAFQIGVWEIVYDDGLSLADGLFRAKYPSLPEVALAQIWLDGLTGNGPFAPLRALSSPDYQDHLVLVPLPSAAWGGAALLLTIALLSRRLPRLAFSGQAA